jgi:hypothetical protein
MDVMANRIAMKKKIAASNRTLYLYSEYAKYIIMKEIHVRSTAIASVRHALKWVSRLNKDVQFETGS